jgi:hypothetical protein
MRARAKKNNYKNGTKFDGLQSQLAYDGRWTQLLQTPNASDWKDVSISKENYKKGGHQMKHPHQLAEMYYKGLLPTPTAQDNPHPTNQVDEDGRRWTKGAKASHSMGLADMAYMGLLPTPQASEGEKFANKYKPSSQMGRSLSAMAGGGLLPTPRVSDTEGSAVKNVELKNGKFSRTNSKGVRWGVKLKDVVEGNLFSTVCYQKTGGEIFRLNPLFTEEMMGFPLMWTALPFLSQNGK